MWLALAGCGPHAPAATTAAETGTTGPDPVTSTDAPAPTGGASTGDAPTGDTSTSDAPTGGPATSEPALTSTGAPDITTTSGDPGSSDDATTDGPCELYGTCEENRHCTPEARVNAEVAGDTPLGAFAGTFAYSSSAIAFGDLGTVTILPEYRTDLCAPTPKLVLELGDASGEDFEVVRPVVFDDGAGATAEGTATVHVMNCCDILWFCDCDNPSPFRVEFTVASDGWSITGAATPNCCRSYSIDEAA